MGAENKLWSQSFASSCASFELRFMAGCEVRAGPLFVHFLMLLSSSVGALTDTGWEGGIQAENLSIYKVH